MRLAAYRGHEEAAWLVDRFQVPGAFILGNDDSFVADGTPRSDRYRWWFLSLSGSTDLEYPSILKCAEAGDAMCQHIVAERYDDEADYDNAAVWYYKAAKQDFARSAHRLSILFKIKGIQVEVNKQESHRFLHQAANLNYQPAIRDLHNVLYPFTPTSIDFSVDEALLETRACIMNSWRSLSPLKKKLDAAKLNFNNPETRNDAIGLYYTVGRDFDGYDYYHMRLEGTIGGDVSVPTAKLYRQMTSKARQSTIWTILLSKSIGICRDIAIVIAQLVYASRMDAGWYIANQ